MTIYKFKKKNSPTESPGNRVPRKDFKNNCDTWKDAQRCSLPGKYKSKPHSDITSRQSEWLKWTNQETIEAGKDVEKWEPSCTVGGNANWCGRSGKQHGGSSKKLKIELPDNPANVLLGIYPRDTGVLMHRGTCTPMFTAALSTTAKLWKEPNAHQLMNG